MNDEVFLHGQRHGRWVGWIAAVLLAMAATLAQGAVQLTVEEEAPVALSSFNYNGLSANVTLANGFLLCANTPWAWGTGASGTPTTVRIVPSNTNLEFGVVSATNTPIVLNDVRTFRYSGGSTPAADLNKGVWPGTLACFVTNAAGTRVNWFNGLFVDGFEPVVAGNCSAASPESCISMSVSPLVTDQFSHVIYTYYIDYHLPPGSANYTLRDGYNSARFGQTISWCHTANQASTACASSALASRTIDVPLSAAANAATNGRIKVIRQGLAGVSIADMQATSGPLVIAALFPDGPARSVERNLADNVRIGTGFPSDQSPIFNTLPGSFTASEVTGMNAVSFTISDDTVEVAGSLLRATATVRFGTLGSFPAVVDCGSPTPQVGPPVRACTVSFVPGAGFVNFATAAAAGISADIVLTATDTLSQSASTAAIPLTVNSTVNSPPVYTASQPLIDVSGQPTVYLTCTLNNPGKPCGVSGTATYAGFLSALFPGPADAQDELALQEAYVETLADNRLSCQGSSIFTGFGPPRITGSGGSYTLAYTLVGTLGSSLCDVVIRDRVLNNGSFPAGQSSESRMLKLYITVE